MAFLEKSAISSRVDESMTTTTNSVWMKESRHATMETAGRRVWICVVFIRFVINNNIGDEEEDWWRRPTAERGKTQLLVFCFLPFGNGERAHGAIDNVFK